MAGQDIERLFHGIASQCVNGCGHIEREPDSADYDFNDLEDRRRWDGDQRLLRRRWQRHALRCVLGYFAKHIFRAERQA